MHCLVPADDRGCWREVVHMDGLMSLKIHGSLIQLMLNPMVESACQFDNGKGNYCRQQLQQGEKTCWKSEHSHEKVKQSESGEFQTKEFHILGTSGRIVTGSCHRGWYLHYCDSIWVKTEDKDVLCFIQHEIQDTDIILLFIIIF